MIPHSFYNKTSEWRSFLNGQKKNYPQIDSDLKSKILSLSNIFFIKENDRFEFNLVRHIEY